MLRSVRGRLEGDYVFSLKPDPAEMVCCGFDPERIRRKIKLLFRIFPGVSLCRISSKGLLRGDLRGDFSKLTLGQRR
jgi:hypothetical protein